MTAEFSIICTDKSVAPLAEWTKQQLEANGRTVADVVSIAPGDNIIGVISTVLAKARFTLAFLAGSKPTDTHWTIVQMMMQLSGSDKKVVPIYTTPDGCDILFLKDRLIPTIADTTSPESQEAVERLGYLITGHPRR